VIVYANPYARFSVCDSLAHIKNVCPTGVSILRLLLTALLAISLPLTATAQEAASTPAPLSFQSLELLKEQDLPGACLNFDRPLDAAIEDLKGYVSLTPNEPDVAIKIKDEKICLEGLSYGQRYDVTLKMGLRAEDGGLLESDLEQTIEVEDRAPTLSFKSSGLVLPKVGGEGLPLRTVNVDEAKVQILRINDRNLVNAIAQGRANDALSKYGVSNLANEEGERVYEGLLKIKSQSNKWVVTTLPVKDVVKSPKPGIYVAVASDANPENKTSDWRDLATQWFIISDIGLATYQGEDGLLVVSRALSSAQSMADLKLTLFARNNTELGSAKTDKAGQARFAPGLLRGEGGNAPQLLMAESSNGDFAFLNLNGSLIDLSDRGVGGRSSAGALDAYITTERGIYRPGETVHTTLLLRDRALMAASKVPLTIKITRPDGAEFETRQITETAAGGYTFDFATETSSMSGTWSFEAYTDINLPAIGSVTFQVDDFQPPRLEFSLTAESNFISPLGEGRIALDGQFLYGAPAANLPGQANAALRIATTPYPDFKEYQFGLIEENFLPVRAELPEFSTDETGKATIDINLGQLPDTTHPLEAGITAQLFDVGGRPVERDVTLPVQNLPEAIGIQPDSTSFAQNSEAGFNVVSLDIEGQPIKKSGLIWNLYEETYDYYWYRSGSDWNYEPVISSMRAGTGKLDTLGAEPARLVLPLKNGYYRLEIRDPVNQKQATSVRFTSGWWANPRALNKPDAITITRDSTNNVKPGDEISVRIKAPYAAEATILTATHNANTPVLASLPTEGQTVKLKVPPEAATGFYVLTSAVQKQDAKSAKPARRAMGVLWVPIDPTPHQLKATIDTPELTQPNQTIMAKVRVEGTGNEPVYMTLAAVDDGVLQLTGYTAPDPEDWYLGQRQLELVLRDIYGDLIDSSDGERGDLRQGGDMGAGRQLKGLPQPTVKVVSLYSGIVDVKDGVASIPLALPDFNGRLRLMATVWSAARFGQTEREMTVRAPLVADLMLPRFLAPGDEAQVQLSIDNRDAPEGHYQVSLTPSGPVNFKGPDFSGFDLKRGERKALPLTLAASTIGEAGFDLQIKGPQEFSLSRKFNISVRAGNPYVSHQTISVLNPGKSVDVANAALSEFLPGSAELNLSISATPDMNVPALLAAITRYPYGCAEQTTSTAMPLLYINDVAKDLGLGSDAALRGRVTAAIKKLATMQRADGGFGLWSARDSYEIWLTSYIADFVTRAAKLGYQVPDNLATSLLKKLADTLKNETPDDRDITARAYAYYMLARNGMAEVADLRYFADNFAPRLQSALARVQLSAALKLAGDKIRSDKVFASRAENPPHNVTPYYDYGSNLRDDAAMLVIMAEQDMGTAELMLKLAGNIATGRDNTSWMSTQEQAWALLAAHAMYSKADSKVSVSLNGESITQSKPIYRKLADLSAALKIENTGKKDVYQILDISGIPLAAQPQEEHGYAITRKFYTPNGQETDLKEVQQNDLIVVVLEGSTYQTYSQAALVADLLPAGFEIENVRISGNNQMADMAWLGTEITQPRSTEFRADRYVAALDLGEWYNTKEFRLVYLMRAVTPGTFFQPGAFVEDMYRPANFARGASGTVKIHPAK